MLATLQSAAHMLRAFGHAWPEAAAVEWAAEKLAERDDHGDHS